jgi:hypothetical protein
VVKISAGDDGMRESSFRVLTRSLLSHDLFATQAIVPLLTHAYGVTPAAMAVAVNASTLGMAVASLVVAFFSQRLTDAAASSSVSRCLQFRLFY